jgi:glycosyltransferase involved in cell wall biosynthesis
MTETSQTTETVLYISPSSSGGLAPYANDFCNALSDLGKTVILLTFEPFEIASQFRRYRLESASPIRIRTKLERFLCLLKMLFRALQISYSKQPSMVIMNGYWMLLSWCYLMFRPRSMPVFCIQHEVDSRLGKHSIGWFQRDFYRRATGLIVHNDTDAFDLLIRKYGVRNQIICIDLGLYESEVFGQNLEPASPRESTVLNFGTVRPDKGVDVLLEAYPGASACAGLRLQIAGNATTEYARRLDTLIEQHDHKEDIEWHRNYIPLESVARYHREASFVVLPFVVGRQSATLRMAIFFGKPVVVSDTGEAPILVRRYGLGLVVPPNDSAALRAALVEFSNNASLREECAARARALQASSDLSWQTIVKGLLEQINIGL